MGGVQVYNPVDGLSRMIADVEKFLNPIIVKAQPVIKFLTAINFYLVIGIFFAMLFYLIFIRQHSIMRKLRKPANYFASIIFIGIYVFLMNASLRLGKDSLGQEITLSVDFIVMPMAVKLLGPVVGCAFGMIQYGASFMLRGETFNITYMLVAGISAMLYGRFLYQHRTRYLRCFTTKLMVNLLCNILLVPFYDIWRAEYVASAITNQMVLQIIFAPIQAAAIYIALIAMRKVRKMLSEVSWGL